ncbi:iron siderophore-binding protein [Corynebacterium sp. NML140438]|uniref:ABC transporter substrate-binding protein n=1 Tax=Corynebacterium sp. NML140438 TaxID=1906334 RepID=UPI0008FB3B4E|nr:ABC transporter substrate-binding protein [Corynebacterium sp. NML140438]OIR40855.1 iron siderophore-binding protein [Corynebacterium sp. NML140438]
MTIFSRRIIKLAAATLTAGLVLTGCSRGEGEAPTKQADQEMRVASLGLGDVDTLLALGITPVAIAPWGAQGDGDPSGVGPWAKEMLGDARPTTIYNTASGFTADVLEQVAATDPTQIIAVNQAVDVQAQDSLENIAPTTLKPSGYEDWQIPWDKQVETIAAAVDKAPEGEKLIEDTKKAFSDFKADHPELEGKRAAIVMPYEGKIGLYTAGDGRGQFIESLGFTIPEDLQGDGSSFFVDYAPENYAALNDVDYLFVLDYNGAVDALKNTPAFANLDVVRDGRVRYLETDAGNAMSMPNPVTIPWAIEKFAEQLP